MVLFRKSELNCNSFWYVPLETPISLAQAVGSPVPPPRQRHNPFNKPSNGPHQRSNSMRSAPGRNNYLMTNYFQFIFLGRMDDNVRNSDPQANKASISFWELHNSYGRPILTDFNSWKHAQRMQKEKDTVATENLINL
ncbi:hypothetical protein RI129_010505 [Pyrocoelia pectoralis]|uniref:Uncharacterized protein n=1 Tax=Pyrocoelia pectoralis TaxID=417401 RepID=A0AAN7VAL9_9COLE